MACKYFLPFHLGENDHSVDCFLCSAEVFKFLFILRDRAQMGEGQREKETQNLKQAPGSELSAQSPTSDLNPRTTRS